MPVVRVYEAGVPRIEDGKLVAPGSLQTTLTIDDGPIDSMREAASVAAQAYMPGRRVRAVSKMADGTGYSVTMARKD